MTKERRTIDAALHLAPAQLNFIAGQLEPPQTITVRAEALPAAERSDTVTMAPDPQELAHQSPRNPRKERTLSRNASRTPRLRHSVASPSSNPVGGRRFLIPLTTRLNLATSDALRRAALENRLRGLGPATVQQIAEQAILNWLQKQGYLRELAGNEGLPRDPENATD